MSLLDLPAAYPGTLYEIVEWSIRLVMLFVVPLRRGAAATRGWLLLILLLPIPGLILFWLIGRPRFPEWRAQRFVRLTPMFEELSARLLAEAPKAAIADAGIPALARTLGLMPAVGGNAFDLIDDYDAGIDRLVADIDAATTAVRILSYILADDATATKVIDALARARARGLPVHVMFDPVGSHKWRRGTLAKLKAAGATVQEALPFHLIRARTRRDMRNHRKLFLIDGTIGYVGSQNIVARDFRPGVVNREMLVRVTGPVVAEMNAVFLADWYLETEVLLDEETVVPPATGDAVLQMLPSGADYRLEGFETMLVWQIHAAMDRVTIVTPYLIPDDALVSAMRTARARGVEIDLIVSAVVDQRLVHLAQCSYYEAVLAEGVRIHRYRDYLLHAKSVSIDRRLAIVGSSNVDLRSFQLNEEVSLLLLDADAIERIEQVQRGYIAASDPLTLDEWRRRPRVARVAENLAQMVSPLL
ncbi:phospholipase D-like domain-containing protein [Sphingomonas sp.]|uniref:phospholipase D-like domain-containing protein n=1 Tax=Sphingomonas sp. TaxID=28214 RepID=UPI003AFFDB01